MAAVSHRHIFRYRHMDLQSSFRQTFLTSSAGTFTSFIQKQQDPVQNNYFRVMLLNNKLQSFLYSSHFSYSNLLLTAAGNQLTHLAVPLRTVHCMASDTCLNILQLWLLEGTAPNLRHLKNKINKSFLPNSVLLYYFGLSHSSSISFHKLVMRSFIMTPGAEHQNTMATHTITCHSM